MSSTPITFLTVVCTVVANGCSSSSLPEKILLKAQKIRVCTSVCNCLSNSSWCCKFVFENCFCCLVVELFCHVMVIVVVCHCRCPCHCFVVVVVIALSLTSHT